MNRVYDYIIAGIRLRSDIDLVEAGLRGFRVFATEEATETADCHIHINNDLTEELYGVSEELSTSYVLEADADSRFMRTHDGYMYAIKRRMEGAATTLFHINTTTNSITTNIATHDGIDISIMRFGIWVMFGVVMAPMGGVAIHSSCITCDGAAILFLGESGTGKSTHTRLWRENITGARLLNDDSPIVRVVDGVARVYGSPWSGKTPCYKNEDYPIAGFCRLAQAPYNKIQRLPTILAIGALLPSCPPLFAHDERLQDMMCATIGKVISKTPLYRLECLPNAAAAELSRTTILG